MLITISLMWSVKINKDRLKFSSSHFTIFNENEAESLHGHNYYVTIEVFSSKTQLSNGLMIDVCKLKEESQKILKPLDEKILLPKNSPFLKVETNNSQVEVTFSKKFYSFPMEDVVILDTENITMETLAYLLSHKFSKSIEEDLDFKLSLQETKGQEASYTYKSKSKEEAS